MTDAPTWLVIDRPGGPIVLERFRGPRGARGLDGQDGAAGADGQDGDPGPPGETGPTGATFVWAGAWASATSYVAPVDPEPGDLVSHGGAYYGCVSPHVSDASTEPGVGGSWDTVWALIADIGVDGTDGIDGTDATIAVGTVTTLASGADATVANVGTPSAAVLDFGIPQGVAGADGADGANGLAGADGIDGTDGVDADPSGWVALAADALSYASGPTNKVGVANTSSDLTAILQLGDWVGVTIGATVVVGKLVAKTSGTVSLYLGTTLAGTTDYQAAWVNAAFTAPRYSHAKSPAGAITDPAKWTELFAPAAALDVQASPAQNTGYGPGSPNLSLPIGAWLVTWQATVRVITNAAVTDFDAIAGLNTTSQTTVPNADFSNDSFREIRASGTHTVERALGSRGAIPVTVTVATTIYLSVYTTKTTLNGAGAVIGFDGFYTKTRIRAVCAYL